MKIKKALAWGALVSILAALSFLLIRLIFIDLGITPRPEADQVLEDAWRIENRYHGADVIAIAWDGSRRAYAWDDGRFRLMWQRMAK